MWYHVTRGDATLKKNEIMLSKEQRKEMEDFSRKGVHSVRLVNRAKIILALDTSEGRKASKQEEIAERVGVSRQVVNNTRRDFMAAGSVEVFLQRKQRDTPPVAPKITGDVEAKIIALACGKAPEGCSRWTIKLIAERSVELQLIDSISPVSVQRLLKKRNLSLT
jgi:transposase